MEWDDDIRFLKGVGPKRAARFERLSVRTPGQLLCLFPRAYIDFTNPVPVAAAPYHTPCAVRAEVLEKQPARRISGGRTLYRVLCADESAVLTLTFFNSPYAADKLKTGESYLLYGKVGGRPAAREMASPVFLPAGTRAPLTPVYPLTEGLSGAAVAGCAAAALAGLEEIPDPLPAEILARYRLPSKRCALRMVHAPADMDEVRAARRRLAFEELLLLQLGMLMLRGGRGEKSAPPCRGEISAFEKALPFALTAAQRRAIGEAAADMARGAPMNRLLQGDVGSGKTAVAAAGVYIAAQSGCQSVLMAPTEVLARQHAGTLAGLLEPLGVRTALLTGAVKGAARREVLRAVESGEAQLLVGTHAVLGEPVRFCRLGFAVTDEQHRFGVRQRALLADKAGGGGRAPHLLVMSATPIPRTLALLVYGDLDVSALDELPPGRKPVKTRAVPAEKRGDMFGFLARQVAAGRQVYVVCPLVEEGEGELQAAEAYAREIARPLLPAARVGVMHGRLKSGEKAAVMDAFKRGEIDLLVSTTVIEVGVDVPNATVMVIEDAERYGLSALHQLRGRVGRGAAESWCFLVSGGAGEAAKARLRFMCGTQDGFAIAQYDLETRGPGDFLGERQHGLPALRVAELAADTRALRAARAEAEALLGADPSLARSPALARAVRGMFEEAYTPN